ncbi:hypothetical protein COT97_00560 [Candidatus Falkowbacteria bacterium CG10_big_fil_rev_8_21_14_0_10_39_11]|uniref:Uncharacterized protein n=1 Tax=Candidatus Falkowbacteria bacterium CG10_big_fil_rev_8_21_14_0_10_39_11 TaxID=1974565 RepID=A0A2H0V8C9_9BACT|nr:MAG: hypothetical protein COT97_00560 [Candidatus Falkowbacteria bacterium CG10_big_fil_rev_8_21_14_0_10_39_11]
METPHFETIKSPREQLIEMEKSGHYVFHGSFTPELEFLEPRQAVNQNEETGKMEPDRDPAVFATPYADIAIFRSLINGEGVSGDSTSGFGMSENDNVYLQATTNLLEAAKNKTGYIYVFNKNDFSDFEGTECRAHSQVKPEKIIKVNFIDLPQNIKILN